MSESILRALMQLFAIVAMDDDSSNVAGRGIVKQFLDQILSSNLVEKYLVIFDEYSEAHKVSDKKKARKKTSLNSVKLLKICSQINEELEQRQKIIVVLRLLEFIYEQGNPSDQDFDFVDTVSETFNIPREEYNELKGFVSSREVVNFDSENILTISSKEDENIKTKHLVKEGLIGNIAVLRIISVNLYMLKYVGTDELFISGMPVIKKKVHIMSHGASVRTRVSKGTYFSAIIGEFLSEGAASKIVFEAKNVEYKFPKGNKGLRSFYFREETGHMVGIMGGSGSGKSTLLNVLNGNYTPSQGSVTMNGVDIHHESEIVEGQIGYVAQDDLLIEELTVFQNLFYTAKLCFGKKDDKEISDIVYNMLAMLGLSETAELKVGNPLEKTISGGQRKRLNIALELIREPAILFIDEPTSGLSSRDSDNIMNLLKELSLKGKLIFVVIHQPSSPIFKMFDRLLVMDQGGFPIFNGNPVESIRYFKKHAHHANDESECNECGNVNPELLFNIVEAKMVDEYGKLSDNRKESPEDWNNIYMDLLEAEETVEEEPSREMPETSFKTPNVWNQFKVFLTRDVLSKLTNRQYMLINMLEAPALAAILAFFLKFFSIENEQYVFRLNENIPVYIFISVIVALFIGLTVSSEEIIRDKRIRARESFLNLSSNSYIFSKICVMLAISAVQMILYVLVGSYILEIKGMNWAYWLVLFSTASFANILGLNISATFNSAKVIYILIPIMIIPQLLFSGIIVKFDKLHPYFSSQKGVPLVGNVMASRWAYEAMAVKQFKDNDYEKNFYMFDRYRKYANWKKDHWKKEIQNKINFINLEKGKSEKAEELKDAFQLLRTEIKKESAIVKNIEFTQLDKINPKDYTTEVGTAVTEYLDALTKNYVNVFNDSERAKQDTIYNQTKTKALKAEYVKLYNDYTNQSLEYFVTNRNDLHVIAEYKNELIQKKDLIYSPPFSTPFFQSNFYAPEKNLFGKKLDTFWANVLVIWGMFILLAITLFFDFFNRLGTWLSGLSGIFKK